MRFHAFIIVLSVLFVACTKIDTTRIGIGLIPEVDNINTFDTILPVVANNYIPVDSTRLRLSDEHVVGSLTGDERFGDSKASAYFEMKPGFPTSFLDTLVGLDSIVLVLKSTRYYGAEEVPLKLNLYPIAEDIEPDTLTQPIYMLNKTFAVNKARLLGTKTMTAKQLSDTVDIKRGDSVYSRVVYQIRIPVDKSYFQNLWRDTAVSLKTDSAFEKVFNGFALEADGAARSAFYFQLTHSESGLEFYYRTKAAGTSKIDTTSLLWKSTALNCGHANNIERMRTGAELENFLVPNPLVGHEQIYLQSTPGVMAKLTIPALPSLTNRVVHRAELRLVQLGAGTPTATDFTPPPGILLDRNELNSDTSYTGMPFDLSPLQGYFCFPANSGIDFSYFGGVATKETISGESVTVYRINISRYVQNVISKGDPLYTMRLSAPFYSVYSNCTYGLPGFAKNVFPYTSSSGFVDPPMLGQVRLAGGNHPNANLRMQLRIIYSKL